MEYAPGKPCIEEDEAQTLGKTVARTLNPNASCDGIGQRRGDVNVRFPRHKLSPSYEEVQLMSSAFLNRQEGFHNIILVSHNINITMFDDKWLMS